MSTLAKLILDKIKSSVADIHHDEITRMYPHQDTPTEIHNLYMTDKIGLRSDGMLYQKFN